MSRAGATRLHGFTANSEVSCCVATSARWLPTRASAGSVPSPEVAVATCHLATHTPEVILKCVSYPLVYSALAPRVSGILNEISREIRAYRLLSYMNFVGK